MSLLDAATAVVQAFAIDVDVSNLCVLAVKDTGNLLESGATRRKVSFDSNWRGGKTAYRVST